MTSKVAFWNLERLGNGTDDERKHAMLEVLGTWKADVTIVCELTTKSTFPPATNLTYRKKNAHQLCYAAWDAKDAVRNLTMVTPQATADYKAAKQKGGNCFSQLANRALAYVGPVDDVHVYTIHAPASHKAGRVMAFVGCSLNEVYGKDACWLVVGDFNVIPEDLAMVKTQIELKSLIRRPKHFTHMSRSTKATSVLDYALANFPCTVQRMESKTWFPHSDHSPILVKF